jgi:cobalt-zinc-cadmium efflux system outer membrane protein
LKGSHVKTRLLAAAAVLPLGACASTNPQPAFDAARRTVAERTGQDARWARDEAAFREVRASVRELLKNELTPESAVRIALVNNPGLQATYEEVGIAQADLAAASRIENPEIDLMVRFPSAGHQGRNEEGGLALDLLSIFTQPLRKKVAAAELEQTKLRVGDEMLRVAAEAKSALYALEASRQLVARLELILDVDRTAAEFAQRQHDAGTINDLDLRSQTVVYQQTRVELAQARLQVRQDQERMNRLLGLWGPDTEWKTAAGLPEIPAAEVPLERLETHAMTNRLDLEAGRWGVDLIGRAIALRKGTRFFPIGLHAGVSTEKGPEEARVTGPTLALQFPLFDLGGASIARLESEHRRAQRQLEDLAVHARSEVREARDKLISSRDVALHYRNVILPQRVEILDLTLRQYNMMLRGAYDVLLAKQAEVAAEHAYIDAWRDYWIARTELERAVGGKLPPQIVSDAGTGKGEAGR